MRRSDTRRQIMFTRDNACSSTSTSSSDSARSASSGTHLPSPSCDATRSALPCSLFIYLRQGGGTCFARVCLSVCLSFCLLARLLKTRAWIWMKCCVSADVGTWTNWLTFEPDPDAGTRLLSLISYRLRNFAALHRLPASCAATRNFTLGKYRVYVLAARR